MNAKIKWVEDNGTWQTKCNLQYGVIMPLSGAEDGDYKYVYGVMLDPGHAARWRHAKTLRGAKWLCGKVLRHGSLWKERRNTSTEELIKEFHEHVQAIEMPGVPAKHVYFRCNSMRRIWEELVRRGVDTDPWPDEVPSGYPTAIVKMKPSLVPKVDEQALKQRIWDALREFALLMIDKGALIDHVPTDVEAEHIIEKIAGTGR